MPHDGLTADTNGWQIRPIPDRTIGALLPELAERTDDVGEAKGHNIVSGALPAYAHADTRTQTVIFDCCHPGSGTREFADMPARLERGFQLERKEDLIRPTLDKEIWIRVPDERAIAVAAPSPARALMFPLRLVASLRSPKKWMAEGSSPRLFSIPCVALRQISSRTKTSSNVSQTFQSAFLISTCA